MTQPSFPYTPEDDWNALCGQDWPTLTDYEKLRRLRATFHHAVIGEMRRSLPCIKIGTALLAFCALDLLGALATGNRASQGAFKVFCKTYLLPVDPRYDCDRLWGARWRLAHNYSMEDAYRVTWNQGVPLHLSADPAGQDPRPLLELEQFITDIETAGEALFVAAATHVGVRGNVLRQANRAAPLGLKATQVRTS